MKLMLLYYFEALNEKKKSVTVRILHNSRTEMALGMAQPVNGSGYRSGLQMHLGGRD